MVVYALVIYIAQWWSIAVWYAESLLTGYRSHPDASKFEENQRSETQPYLHYTKGSIEKGNSIWRFDLAVLGGFQCAKR